MKKKYLSILAALICVLGLGVTAKAQSREEIVVTFPFEVVVSGKTLPAGTYKVSRVADEKSVGLIVSSYANHVSVFVHPLEIEDAPNDHPQVSFERVGEQHFLSKIRTAYDVYSIPVTHSEILLAGVKSHMPVSGSSAGN